jgi:hypothetical protein
MKVCCIIRGYNIQFGEQNEMLGIAFNAVSNSTIFRVSKNIVSTENFKIIMFLNSYGLIAPHRNSEEL